MPAIPFNEGLDAAQQSQLYSYLDHPKHALTLTCFDACNLQLVSSSGGLRLFLHKSRPTVFAHLMGRIVGIEEKEKKVAWLVDDGSAVIAVHHMFKQTCNTSPSKERLRPSRKGKEREVNYSGGGIPIEYLLPPPPPLPSHREEREKGKKVTKAPVNVADAFEIGQLVSIVGRVELWLDRRERIVFVDNVEQKMTGKYDKLEHEGVIRCVADCNEEPRHLVRALELSATEYSMPYKLLNSAIKERADWIPTKLREITSSAGRPIEARDQGFLSRQLKARVMEEPQVGLRVMEDVSDLLNKRAVRKRTLGAIRHPLQEKANKKDKTDVDVVTEKSVRILNDEQEKIEKRIDISSSLLSTMSTSSISTPRQRQLRHYTKLTDSKLTDSTFRVYVEKYIIDNCSERASPDTTPKASTHKSFYCPALAQGEPPAFTLSYLMQDPDLLGHAKRTVEVLTRRREEKRRRKAASSTSIVKDVTSTEKVCDKMKRLYSSVVQAMLMDGIIVLASSAIQVKPSSAKICDRQYQNTLPQEDAYQVVTPTLLAESMMDILSRPGNITINLDSVKIVNKMQAVDERWRFIRLESVQESMQLLLPSKYRQDEM